MVSQLLDQNHSSNPSYRQDLNPMAKNPAKVTLEEIHQFIDGASYEELAEVKKSAGDKMDSLKYMIRDQLRSDLQAKLALYGFTATELGLGGAEVPKRGRKPRSDAGATGGAPVRYRHPTDPTLTWSGRGRPARWLQELVDAGQDREKFRVTE